MAFERMTEEVKNVSKLPNVITGQAASLKSTFDEAGSDLKTFINNFLTVLESAIAASNIGAMNGELESNVQAVIDTFSAAIADRYTKSEIDSKVAGDTNDLIKNLEIDLNTGIFTITKKDGTTQTIDTTLEKIPTNFAFVEENGTYYLRVTNTDGTSTQVDVTELFNDYTFNNSETVAFTTVKDGNKATITAEIRDASIGLEKLSLTAISQLEEYAAGANAAAQTATQKASEAKASADEALASANTAVSAANSAVGIEASALNSANSASTSASNSATYATEASTQATLSRSWAVGGTGSRTGEDTNNAKYWAEQARESSQGGDMQKATYDTNGDGVVDNAEKLGGQLPSYYAKTEDFSNLSKTVAEKAVTKYFTATIPITGWSSSTPYTIELQVAGMLETDSNFTVSPVYSIDNSDNILEAWSKITLVESATDKIKVYCKEEIPTAEIPIQITVVR